MGYAFSASINVVILFKSLTFGLRLRRSWIVECIGTGGILRPEEHIFMIIS